MKTHTFSIVVGTSACNFRCPFCVSRMTCQAARQHIINWPRFEIACRIVEQARDGLVNVLITGTGEPCLYPGDITLVLENMRRRFPLVTLQTNGSLLTPNLLRQWRGLGLTQVCISIASDSPARSNEILEATGEAAKDFWEIAGMVHNAGLSVRLNCTMLREGIRVPSQVECLINRCLRAGIEQLTLREVDRPSDPVNALEVAEYVDAQKPVGAAHRLFHYLMANGAIKLLDLPHGGVVFEYRDQNVCISNCLTDTTDPNDIRQIIFFPDGRIAYDWKYKGARIL